MFEGLGGWGRPATALEQVVRQRRGHCVSRWSLSVENMTTAIVRMCAAFGLTVSEATSEVMCLRPMEAAEMGLRVSAAGRAHNQAHNFVHIWVQSQLKTFLFLFMEDLRKTRRLANTYYSIYLVCARP